MEVTTIEPLKSGDHEAAARWLSNPENNQWLSSTWRGRMVEAKHLSVVAMSPKNKVFLVRSGQTPAGLAALGCLDSVDHSGMLWYLLGDPARRGKGIMTEAVRLLVRHAFEELGLRSISASVMATNPASLRVLEKAGFTRAGVFRQGLRHPSGFVDRILYDVVPEDLGLSFLDPAIRRD